MNMRGKNIFVTGGAGFIGSHIVDALVEGGATVTIYDNFSSGTIENIRHLQEKVRVIEGDIRDYETLEKSMKSAEIVSHQAAQLEIFLSSAQPETDLEINVVGTLNVLKAAQKNAVQKVVNASSACVYGQVNSASKESDNTNPNWPYGVSKLAAEKYAQIFSQCEGVPVVSLRYGIVYGEREWYRRVLPIFLKRILLDLPPVVFGDGGQIRDFIYVRDVVAIHNLCILDDRADGHVINVGTGVPVTVADLAGKVVQLVENKIPILFEETKEGEFSKAIPDKKRNTSELKTMLLDITKAKQMLGWQPKTPLIDGLRAEYQWARQNLHRWQKIFYTVV